MTNYWNFLKNSIKSSFTRFIIIKYVTFFIQFINSILIAKLLGPYAFGIYSFLTLVIQYFSYSGLGINYSLNTTIALKKSKKKLTIKIWQNSLGIMILVNFSLLIIGVLLHYVEVGSFSKYSYWNYHWWVIALTILYNFNLLFVNLFRVYGKLNEISFYEGIGPIFILIALIYYNKDILVIHIVYCLVLKNLISLIIFAFRSPLPNLYKFDIRISRILILRGINLLIYNLSYLFIMLSARSLVSIFYTVEDLANYSFANSLSNNLLMIAGVFSFLFYPKMIHKLGIEKNTENIIQYINRFNSFYLEGINALTFFSMLVLPLMDIFLGEYSRITTVFIIIIVSQLLINSSLGYSIYLIAIKKESNLTRIGLLAILIITLFGTITSILNFSLEFMTLGVLIAGFFYLYNVIYTSARLMNFQKSVFKLMYDCFGWSKIIPLITLISSTLVDNQMLLIAISLLLYVLLNTKKLILVIKDSIPIMFNKSLLKF